MGYRDHEPIILSECKGLYRREDGTIPPEGYLVEAQNVVYQRTHPNAGASRLELDSPFPDSIISSREGLASHTTTPQVFVRFYYYMKSTGARVIGLRSNGDVWDVTANAVILNVASAVDFHGITINDHFYMTFHNRIIGQTGTAVQVYDPSLAATSRQAGGAPASGSFTGAVSATNGNIEPGIHIVAVSYETNTGFRTKPALHFQFTAPVARKRLDLSAIPTAGAGLGVTKRLIWMSKVVREFDGNLENPELFLVYTINDNTTTSVTGTIDAYDSQLVSSADPYNDLVSAPPAGTFLNMCNGRLVISGNADDLLYISLENEPEAFDAVDNLRTIDKGNGGGIRTTRAGQNGNIFAWKAGRTYVLKPNGDTPAEWPFDILDTSLGAECYSVSEVINEPNSILDGHIVVNQSGAHYFNSGYTSRLRPLTYNIQVPWDRLMSVADINKTKVIVDSVFNRIYIMVINTSFTEPCYWFVGDFTNGLSAETIKWSIWDFNYGSSGKNIMDGHILMSSADGTALIALVEGSTTLRRLKTGDATSAVDVDGTFEVSIAMQLADPELVMVHLNSIKMETNCLHGAVSGIFNAACNTRNGLGGALPLTLDGTGSLIPYGQIHEVPFNIVDWKLFPRIYREKSNSTTNTDLVISRMVVYVRQQQASVPR